MTDSDDKHVTAECERDDLFAIGGGAHVSGVTPTQASIAIVETRPTALEGELPGAWTGSAVEIQPTGEVWTLTVYAVCAQVN